MWLPLSSPYWCLLTSAAVVSRSLYCTYAPVAMCYVPSSLFSYRYGTCLYLSLLSPPRYNMYNVHNTCTHIYIPFIPFSLSSSPFTYLYTSPTFLSIYMWSNLYAYVPVLSLLISLCYVPLSLSLLITVCYAPSLSPHIYTLCTCYLSSHV